MELVVVDRNEYLADLGHVRGVLEPQSSTIIASAVVQAPHTCSALPQRDTVVAGWGLRLLRAWYSELLLQYRFSITLYHYAVCYSVMYRYF